MLLTLSPELKELSALIGNGRTQGAVTTTFKMMEGKGVCLPVSLEGVNCGIWLSEQEWASWLESVLAVSDPNCLNNDLLVGMSHWLLSSLQRVLPLLVVSNQLSRPYDLLKQWAVVCTFSLENQQFNAVLFDWPLMKLHKIFADWPSDQPSSLGSKSQSLGYQCGLVAGWCRLSLTQLRTIKVGDGLRVCAAADLENNCCWLWQLCGSQFYIRLSEENQMTIQNINQDIDELLHLDTDTTAGSAVENLHSVSLDALKKTLVMEIGRLDMKIEDIKALSVGQTLACKSSCYGEVGIRLDGQQVGSGNLVRCGEELVVRIDQWALE
ncbi:YscQ/HrcQ family type III secretion apparatus protein [Candidatus Regiella insecticola]|uniref:Type III secretion system protein n=1 Tax=Candidatus Regiella insecticola TaxID=138073 RepID=A0A6L2ZKC4_9ENTR|nr:YscQ/HrcQ family type III secretion apparatus protein [Candidatus Regiella insecticola]GFN45287.1 type III secretion system protein [Candidatus Regiella insecticola]